VIVTELGGVVDAEEALAAIVTDMLLAPAVSAAITATAVNVFAFIYPPAGLLRTALALRIGVPAVPLPPASAA
jgi:hypothetical protein